MELKFLEVCAWIIFRRTERGIINDFKKKVSAKGLEPLTNGLKGHCSAIELRAHEKDGLYSNTHIQPRQ
jgi:hypothetical protein